MNEAKRMLLLILIMIATCVIVSGAIIIILYSTAFDQQRYRLMETAKSQARLMEAIARFDVINQERYHPNEGDPKSATLSQIIDAHNKYIGFGETGEFTLASREGELIVFLLRHRHSGLVHPEPIPFSSDLAEPMRRALSGASGTMVGLDYRGETVLAAYEPIHSLNFGIVAKIDLTEIRAPFIKAGLLTGGLGVIVIFFGAAFFFWVSRPMIRALRDRASELQEMNIKMLAEIEERKQIEDEVQRVAAIVENSEDAIISKTLDGTILRCNKGAERLYGYTEDEIKGKSISILVPKDRPDELPDILKMIRRGETVNHYETVRIRKDGKLVNISLSVSPIKDRSGKILGASTIARDITEREKAAKTLRRSEKRFRELIENSLTGISIVQDNKVIYQNTEQERLFGPLPRKAKIVDLESIHPDDKEKVERFYKSITSGDDQVWEIDFRFYPRERGGLKTDFNWVIIRAQHIELQDKKNIFFNTIDITRTKELERLLRIEDKMSSLGRVAAGIAHEIRNPLSGINVYLNAMDKIYDRREDLKKIKAIIGKIQSASRKIENVIRRVMDFARPSDPKLVLGNINQPVKDAFDLSSVTMRKRGVEIKKNLTEDLPLCRIDTHLIEQVILNLINNAAEAMKEMQRTKRIEINTSIQNDEIVIEIADSGPGVPLDLVEKIFDPFYSTKNGSSGIGLSLSRRIIADHGGSLDVLTSELGGAKFTIIIPIKEG